MSVSFHWMTVGKYSTGNQGRYTQGKAKCQEILSEALPSSITQQPVLPSSLFANVMKYLFFCFKETQTESGFFTKQTWSLGKDRWISLWLVEASSSAEVWINSKQQQSNYYFHVTNAIIFRGGVLEHWLGRRKSKFRLLIARSNPLGCAAFSVFLKTDSMATSFLKRWFILHAGRKHVTEMHDSVLKSLNQNSLAQSRKEKNTSVIVLMFIDHLHHGGGQGWWSASRTRLGPISFASFLSLASNWMVISLLCPTASLLLDTIWMEQGEDSGWTLMLLNPMS